MAETVKIRHSTLSSAANLIRGDPWAPIKESDSSDLNSVFKRADTDIQREAGGFFLDSLGNVLVFGFLTPSTGDDIRRKEYFYDIFECPHKYVDGIDVIALRNRIEQNRVLRADSADFQPELTFNKSALLPDVENRSESWKTVARVWDQYRRGESSAPAQFNDLAVFGAHVDGAFKKVSYVEPNEVTNASKFDFHRSTPPEFNPDRQGYLLKFVKSLAEEADGRPHIDQLPDLAAERQRRLETTIENQIQNLRDRADYRSTLREQWIEYFDEHITELIDDHVDAYIELQQTKLHPTEEFETEDNNLLDELLSSESTEDLEHRLERETEHTIDKIHDETTHMLDALEKTIREQHRQMIKESDLSAQEVQDMEIYNKHPDE